MAAFIISDMFSYLYLNLWNSLEDSHLFFLVVFPMNFKEGSFFFFNQVQWKVIYKVYVFGQYLHTYTQMVVLSNISNAKI